MNPKPNSKQHKKQLEIIGLYLKNLRLGENLSQLELSEQVNLHYNTIQRIESGKNSSLLSIMELADFFQISLSDLMSIMDE